MPFDDLNRPELKHFDVYAGDGHWHDTSSHEDKIQQRRWPVGHVYELNLRNRALLILRAKQYDALLSLLITDLTRPLQRSVKLMRWLCSHWVSPDPWLTFIPHLSRLFAAP